MTTNLWVEQVSSYVCKYDVLSYFWKKIMKVSHCVMTKVMSLYQRSGLENGQELKINGWKTQFFDHSANEL